MYWRIKECRRLLNVAFKIKANGIRPVVYPGVCDVRSQVDVANAIFRVRACE